MPSLMIHLKVGYEIGKIFNLNSYNYYLGLIAPDAPNLNGFAPKEERWAAHVRAKDLNDWRTKLNQFYLKERKNYNTDFIFGYYVHILTDIIFDDYFYISIRTKVIADKNPEKEAHNIMSNDMHNYNFKEFSKIKDILGNSVISYDINNVTKELLLQWKEKNIKRVIPIEGSIYIDENTIEELTNQVYKEVVLFKEIKAS